MIFGKMLLNFLTKTLHFFFLLFEDKENSKLCFLDMKILSRRNGGDSESGLVVYRITTNLS